MEIQGMERAMAVGGVGARIVPVASGSENR